MITEVAVRAVLKRQKPRDRSVFATIDSGERTHERLNV